MTKLRILMATAGVVFFCAFNPAQAQSVAPRQTGETQLPKDCKSIREKIRQLALDMATYEANAHAVWAQYEKDDKAAVDNFRMEQQEMRMSQSAWQDGKTNAANSHYENARSYMAKYQDFDEKADLDRKRFNYWQDEIVYATDGIYQLKRAEAAACKEQASGVPPGYEVGGPSMPLGGLDPAPPTVVVPPAHEPGGSNEPLGGLGPLPPVYRDKNAKLMINIPVGDPDDLKNPETPDKAPTLEEGVNAPSKSNATLPGTGAHGQGQKSNGTSKTKSINVTPNLRAYFASMAQMNGRVLLTGKTSAGSAGRIDHTENKNLNEIAQPTASTQHVDGSNLTSREIRESLAAPRDTSSNSSSASLSSDAQLQATKRTSSPFERVGGLLHGLRLR